LKIGNVNIKKEFGFALDITKAIWLLVNQDKYFECVIGTGEAYSIKNWLEICFESRGEKWENYIETDENFVTDYDILVSNPSKIISLGWHPGYDIYRLANLMLNDLIE
jgi:GDPmannose 4,6-dehydratase